MQVLSRLKHFKFKQQVKKIPKNSLKVCFKPNVEMERKINLGVVLSSVNQYNARIHTQPTEQKLAGETEEQLRGLTVSEVLLGLECELALWRELWLWEFSCGEKLVPEIKKDHKAMWNNKILISITWKKKKTQ